MMHLVQSKSSGTSAVIRTDQSASTPWVVSFNEEAHRSKTGGLLNNINDRFDKLFSNQKLTISPPDRVPSLRQTS